MTQLTRDREEAVTEDPRIERLQRQLDELRRVLKLVAAQHGFAVKEVE